MGSNGGQRKRRFRSGAGSKIAGRGRALQVRRRKNRGCSSINRCKRACERVSLELIMKETAFAAVTQQGEPRMKKTVLALSAAAVCVASAAPVLAEGQNPMTAPVQISMQGEASMTVANDEAVILFSAEAAGPMRSRPRTMRPSAATRRSRRSSASATRSTSGRRGSRPIPFIPVPRKARFPRSEPGRPARPCALRCVT